MLDVHGCNSNYSTEHTETRNKHRKQVVKSCYSQLNMFIFQPFISAMQSYSHPKITFPCSQVHFNYYSSSLICINRSFWHTNLVLISSGFSMYAGRKWTQQMGCFSLCHTLLLSESCCMWDHTPAPVRQHM